MIKEERKVFLVNAAIFQILLLIGTSFFISFTFNEYVGIASADVVDNAISEAFANPGSTSVAEIPPTPATTLYPPTDLSISSSNTIFDAGTGTSTTIAGGAGPSADVVVADAAAKATAEKGVADAAAKGITSAAQVEGTKAVSQGGTKYILSKGVIHTEGGQVVEGASGIFEGPGGEQIFVPGKGTAAPSSGGGFWGIFKGTALGGGVPGALVGGLVWGGIAYGAVRMLGSLFGFEEGLTRALSAAAGLGVGAGTTAGFLLNNGVIGTGGKILGMGAGGFGALVGIGIGAAVFIATYTKEKREIISFECLPYEPPIGGDNCEICNIDSNIPCSEYRCKSLGQACQIVNPGTDNELCVWVTKGDTQAPKIDPWDDALKPTGLRYIPDAAISPPNYGFKIINENDRKGCLQAFTKLEFGIETTQFGKPEPAQCRIDYDLTEKYSEMLFLFGESNLFAQEHTQKLKVPDPSNQAVVPELYNDGTYTLYTRCVDANGNGENSAAVAFSFCVNDGPDTTPPTIEGTDILDGSPVQFDADRVPIEVYVNEPAQCKWSRIDKDYSDMENTMSCATETYQINANLDYVCKADLTGIKNEENNKFFFRCEDFSKAGKNKMRESFPLNLMGTQPLTIDSVGPNGTIKGGQSVVQIDLKVKTAHGADDGRAVCYYSTEKDNTDSYIAMDSTDSYIHNQSQSLEAGNYEYFFMCVDAGGNLAVSSTNFNVFVDVAEPKVARVYRDGSALKLITSEEAECVYSTTNCDYEIADGIALTYEASGSGLEKNIHFTEWNPAVTYYIKCQDLNGRKPRPNQCSVIAQGSEL